MYSEADIEALLKLQGTTRSHPNYSEKENHRLATEERRNDLQPVWIPNKYDDGSGEWRYFHPRAIDLNPRIVFTEDYENFIAEHHGVQGAQILGPVSVAEAVAFIEGTIT